MVVEARLQEEKPKDEFGTLEDQIITITCHSTHPEYGTTYSDYFEQMGIALDVYSSYGRFFVSRRL